MKTKTNEKNKTTETKTTETTAIAPATATSIAPAHVPAPVPAGNRGVVLTSFEAMYRFAKAVHQSGLAPKGFTPESIVVAIQMGAELGLPPMASLQNVAVINGRPCVWGDAVPAVCMASGLFDHTAYSERIERDPKTGAPTKAVCTCRRLPNGNIVEREFSLKQAHTAKLLEKPGPWQAYPDRMLQMRARAYALRDAFPDILRGFYVAHAGIIVDGPEETDAPEPTPSKLGDLMSKLRERRAAPALEAHDETRTENVDETKPPPDLETHDETPAKEEPAGTPDYDFELDGEEEREPGADEDEPPPGVDEDETPPTKNGTAKGGKR